MFHMFIYNYDYFHNDDALVSLSKCNFFYDDVIWCVFEWWLLYLCDVELFILENDAIYTDKYIDFTFPCSLTCPWYMTM